MQFFGRAVAGFRLFLQVICFSRLDAAEDPEPVKRLEETPAEIRYIRPFGGTCFNRRARTSLRQRTTVREAGFRVWLDEWEIVVGDSIIERMQEGLDSARFLILCYSDAGVLAPWMSREWMSALARQLEGHAVKILPVRLSGGSPPALLADIRYADLVRDWERGSSRRGDGTPASQQPEFDSFQPARLPAIRRLLT
jgi:hypothetical protein